MEIGLEEGLPGGEGGAEVDAFRGELEKDFARDFGLGCVGVEYGSDAAKNQHKATKRSDISLTDDQATNKISLDPQGSPSDATPQPTHPPTSDP